ncbi:MAG TPA: glycerophosphodiester phosphodiesterase [Candidatus Dormibacteraeota bacterium]|nr:glycerophosphodiester phosphodiesterase [Candidatus Dormibacteraeota bacterium]
MKPLISAHQGGLQAEGVSAAERYRRAIGLGVDFIEFDVRRTRDGVTVVHHDDWTKSGRAIRDFAYRQLTDELGSEALTLDELLDVAAGHVGLHLDLKEPGYEAEIVQTMLDRCPVDEFVVTSGVEEIRTIKEAFPQVKAGLSIGDDLTGVAPWLKVRHRLRELLPRRRIERSRADFIAVHQDLAVLSALRYCERHRVPAWVWTVDDERSIARFLADRRVTTLITNRPDIALRLR